MPPDRPRRLAILTEGQFGFHHGRTAMGVIRYGTDAVSAVLDSTLAGRNVREWLPGRDIPIVASLDDALALPSPPTALLIGIAPTGGRLPGRGGRRSWAAIRHGLDVHSGLHTFLGDDPELAAAAREAGVELRDYRRPPERMETAVGRAQMRMIDPRMQRPPRRAARVRVRRVRHRRCRTYLDTAAGVGVVSLGYGREDLG